MLKENYLSNDPVNYPIWSNGLSYVKQQETTNKTKGQIIQRLLNRWTSQLDLGCTTGGLERVVSVHNST